ncbi:MAG TPA: hypothetical protein VMT56_00430 [Candidatus Bathyarchaeia archaeon]|nr:hypothetical protein [Candidatus Bathyarchaeia archaeon]
MTTWAEKMRRDAAWVKSIRPDAVAIATHKDARPCACGHVHIAGIDGEDGGCGTCQCGQWRAPASGTREPGGET